MITAREIEDLIKRLFEETQGSYLGFFVAKFENQYNPKGAIKIGIYNDIKIRINYLHIIIVKYM